MLTIDVPSPGERKERAPKGGQHTPSESEAESVDAERAELPWEGREEEYLRDLSAAASQKAEKHAKASVHARRIYNGLGLPSMLLPLIAAALSSEAELLGHAPSSTLMLASALLSGVNTWLDCGARALAHEATEAAYYKVVSAVERELAVPKAYRGACDVVLERIVSAYATAEAGAPSGL